ncbi:MAG TPA: class I SAM-dependent methyltransferase [Pyrinomonadaceae bacterium]
MYAPDELTEVLAEGSVVRFVEDGIYSVFADDGRQHHYDKRAAVYDMVVGTRLYNRVMWGSSPRDYVSFARRAAASRAGEKLLDAGCGSMLFTAETYLECGRAIIAFDQSLAMLRRARQRLIKLSGSWPAHVILLQADLSDPPFRPSAFETVLCMNVLHQFEDAAVLLPKLKSLLSADGHLYLTSLVANNRFIGDRYLAALYATGEFVRPRSNLEFQEILDNSLRRKVSYRTKGNMAYATTVMPL